MTSFASCSFALLIACFCTLVEAESVQERGLPGAVAFEAVFPHVVSGSLGDVQYESDLIIVNSEDRKAVIELDFYFGSGQTANDLLAGGIPNLKRSPDNGRFYDEVSGHSIRRLKFPRRDSSLLGQDFSGWAKLRSNVNISAYQEIRVVDQRGKSYQAEVTPSTIGAGSADLTVFADRRGPNIATSGISLVNPHSTPAELQLELVGSKKAVTLAPLEKRALMLEEISPSYGLDAYTWATLTVRSTNGVSFAVLGLVVDLSLNADSTPRLPEDEPWLTFRSLDPPLWAGDWLRLSGTEPFDWPEEILAEAHLGGTDVVLTRFGFIRKDTQGKTDVQPLTVASSRLLYLGITVDDQHGVGIIWYSEAYVPIPILFKSGRVLYVDAISGPSSIAAVPDQPDRVEIRTGYPCYRTIIVVDTVKEEILSVDHTRDPGAFCL
jgi:hypothetical protein